MRKRAVFFWRNYKLCIFYLFFNFHYFQNVLYFRKGKHFIPNSVLNKILYVILEGIIVMNYTGSSNSYGHGDHSGFTSNQGKALRKNS